MAPRRQYGTTWWGAEWLRALERVDNANRLPRGKTYANTGRVIETKFNVPNLRIEALVDGSAYYPYEVEVGMKPVPAKSVKRLADAIAADPDIVAGLLDGELPKEIAPLCEKLGIELFPGSWRAMHLSCSCPDSARVCKHIAAVFYIIADRIDLDPFFIFEFRGIHLKEELKARGINLGGAVTVKPLSPEALLRRASESFPAADSGSDEVSDDDRARIESEALARLRTLSLSGLPDLADVMLGLYPKTTPISSNKDCSDYLDALWKSARKTLSAIEKRAAQNELAASEGGLLTAPRALSTLCGRITEELGEEYPELSTPGARVLLGFGQGGMERTLEILLPSADRKKPKAVSLPLEGFFPAIRITSAREAEALPAEFECWREISRLAAELLKLGAIVPAVTESPKIKSPAPRVWWLPALRDAAVRRAVTELALGISPWAKSMISAKALKLFPEAEKSPFAAAILLLSAAIAGFLRNTIGNYPKLADREDILDFAISGLNLTPLDGRTAPDAGIVLARALAPFALGDVYPWLPVLTVRTAKESKIKLNFGIIGRNADIRAAAEKELNSPEDEGVLEAADAPNEKALAESPVPTERPLMLSRLIKEPRYAAHRYAALTVLKTLSAGAPVLETIRSSKGRPATLEMEDLRDFLFETAPYLTMLGVTLMLPASMRKLLRPRLTASAGAGEGFSKSLLAKNAIGEFNWKAAIGNREMTAEEFLKLAEAHRGEVIQIDDDFVYLDPAEIDLIRRTLDNPPELSALEKMRAVLTGEYEGTPVEVSPEVREALRHITDVEEVPPPKGLNAALRPYQERGYSWLMKNLSLGLGSLIADDMGLGKTLQVISAILELRNRGDLKARKVLAVLPTTLITNWTREIAKFAPALTVGTYYGADRKLPAPEEAPDVLLTSYGTLRRDYEVLSSVRWKLLVLDEAQAIKNISTAQTAAVRGIRADQVIAMTGTPVENRLMEYWSIFSAVQPKLLGTQKEFAKTFAEPIEGDRDQQAAEAFRRLTAPFMLRRLKTDKSIIADLPEKNTADHYALMRTEQAALYAATLQKLMEKIREAEEAPDASSPSGRMARRGLVLKLITSLKQICNSPSQYSKTEALRPDSGKADAMLEILGQCLEADRKVLIFTQYREMGERLQEWIEAATGERPDFLHGGVSRTERMKMVDRFQTDRTARIFILSLKAGGTGLNLTAASAVIHYDLWWNPAVEAQATDRAFRIGQRRDVLVYRLITAGSFEEKINDMLASKRDLADLTVAAGESWIGDLPTKELNRIFALS